MTDARHHNRYGEIVSDEKPLNTVQPDASGPGPSETSGSLGRSEAQKAQMLTWQQKGPVRRRELAAERRLIAQQKFLKHFAEHGVVGPALEIARVSRSVINKWRQEDLRFAEAYARAEEAAADILEREAFRRAVEGWDRPLYSQRTGEYLGAERLYSDKLMQTLLQARRPKRFGPQVSATIEVPNVVINVGVVSPVKTGLPGDVSHGNSLAPARETKLLEAEVIDSETKEPSDK